MFELLLASVLALSPPDAAALLQSADEMRTGMVQTVVSIRATTRQGDRPDLVAEFDLYVGGDDRQLVVFTDPKNSGRKLLLRDAKAWLMTPGTTHPVAISANQRLSGGASFADVARVRLARDFSGRLRPGTEPCDEPPREQTEPCHVVEIAATVRTAPYAAGTLWVDASGRARRAIYVLPSGKPAKEVRFEYRAQDGRPVLAKAVIVDLLAGDGKPSTTLEYLRYRRTRLADELFELPPAPPSP